MTRLLTVSAAALIAATVFATPETADARTCKIVSARAVGVSEKMATDMAMRQAKRRINRFARRNDSGRARVRWYDMRCKGEAIARCKAKSKVCV